jgi:hypothetical protein
VQRLKTVVFYTGDLQPAGVRSDIDSSEGLHSAHGTLH